MKLSEEVEIPRDLAIEERKEKIALLKEKRLARMMESEEECKLENDEIIKKEEEIVSTHVETRASAKESEIKPEMNSVDTFLHKKVAQRQAKEAVVEDK